MEIQYALLAAADFEENSMLFVMDEPFSVRSGRYAIIRIESIQDEEKLEEFLKEE